MDLIQELRQLLEQFQLDFPKLFAAFAVCLVVFIFSARELACWFFKTHGLKKEQKKISERLANLEDLIKNLKTQPAPEVAPILTVVSNQKASLQFPLQSEMGKESTAPVEDWMNRPLT